MKKLAASLSRAWSKLSPSQRKSVEVGAEMAGTVVARALWKRFLAAGAASAAVAATTVVMTHSGSSTPPIKHAWLTHAGAFKVTEIHVPCPGAKVDLSQPPKGVGHTTEGGWAGSMAVFTKHYAPTFMVGRNAQGVVQIVQFCPLGEMSAALENHAGGVETNRWSRAQIELVAKSSTKPWQADAEVMRAFDALLYTLRDEAGIPLVHVVNANRSAAVWTRSAGWFDHAGVPENAHWDMGAFAWPAALNAASRLAPVVSPGAPERPTSSTPAPNPPAAPAWTVCLKASADGSAWCVRSSTPWTVVARHPGAYSIAVKQV